MLIEIVLLGSVSANVCFSINIEIIDKKKEKQILSKRWSALFFYLSFVHSVTLRRLLFFEYFFLFLCCCYFLLLFPWSFCVNVIFFNSVCKYIDCNRIQSTKVTLKDFFFYSNHSCTVWRSRRRRFHLDYCAKYQSFF